jgi:hypothetical protein
MAEDVYPSLVYFQDNYGMSVEQVLVCGVPDLDELSQAMNAQAGVKVRELIGSSLASGTLRNDFAGAIGALI